MRECSPTDFMMLIKFCYPNQRYHEKGKVVGQTHYEIMSILNKILAKKKIKEKRNNIYDVMCHEQVNFCGGFSPLYYGMLLIQFKNFICSLSF